MSDLLENVKAKAKERGDRVYAAVIEEVKGFVGEDAKLVVDELAAELKAAIPGEWENPLVEIAVKSAYAKLEALAAGIKA